MTNHTPLATTTLQLHADAAAFVLPCCRHASSARLLLAFSTYELVAERNERQGGIHLFDAKDGKLTPLGGVGSGSSGSNEEESAAAAAPPAPPPPPPPPFPGVFDIKWLPSGHEGSLPTLSVALADGSIRLMEVIDGGVEGKTSFKETAYCSPLKVGGEDERERGEAKEEDPAAFPSSSHPLDDPGAMALYLDIDKRSPSRIAVSFSDGRVALLEMTTTMTMPTESTPKSTTRTTAKAATSKLERKAVWRAHDAECWCVSFSPHCSNTVYTGADDCEFSAWDLREVGGKGGSAKKKPRPAWRAGGGGGGTVHSAGVCCISPSPNAEEFLIATGSYDGRVRVWDSRNSQEPLLVCASEPEEGGGGGGGETGSSPCPSPSSAPLGGGAWRLVWHPRGEPRLLCAAMHAGFAVLRLKWENGEGEGEGGKARLEIEQRYRGHGADACKLNNGAATVGYGCDWVFDDTEGKLIAATASFYDNAVHLWEPLLG